MDQICQSCQLPMIGAPGETLTSCPMCGAAIESKTPTATPTPAPPEPEAAAAEPQTTTSTDQAAKPAVEKTTSEETKVAPEPTAAQDAATTEQEAKPVTPVPATSTAANDEESQDTASPEASPANETAASESEQQVDDDNAFAFVAEEQETQSAPDTSAPTASAPQEQPVADLSSSDTAVAEVETTVVTPIAQVSDVISDKAVITEPSAEPVQTRAPDIAAAQPTPQAPTINPTAPSVQLGTQPAQPVQPVVQQPLSQAPPTDPVPSQVPQMAQNEQSPHLQQLANQTASQQSLRPAHMRQPQPPQGQPGLPSSTGQFPALAPGGQGTPSGQYYAPMSGGLPSATGTFPVQSGMYDRSLPSATGQFPAMRMPMNPGSTGTYPVQGMPSQRFMNPQATGSYVAPHLPSPSGQYPVVQAPPQAAPQAAQSSSPGPSVTLMAAELAELIDLTPPTPPWATLAVVVALIAGLAGTGSAYLSQMFLGGPCRSKQPIITVDQEGNQTKSGQDWQCQAGKRWRQKGTWRKGKKEGEWRAWYSNGYARSEGNYVDGQRDGLHRTWHPNGTRASQSQWRKGLRQGTALAWYPNGAKQSTAKWQGGVRSGPSMTWFANGKQKRLAAYQGGQRHGKSTTWYSNGKMKASGAFDKGTPCGEWLHWSVRGELTQRIRHAPCGKARASAVLEDSELKPSKLSGRWRKSGTNVSLNITGKLENNSKDTFSSVIWHRELLLTLNDGQVQRRQDPSGAKLSAISAPLSPNESIKVQWSGQISSALQIPSEDTASIKRIALRVSVKLTTVSGTQISYVFYQATLPSTETKKPFDMLTQPASAMPAAKPAARSAKSKPTKRKSSGSAAVPPPPPPPSR